MKLTVDGGDTVVNYIPGKLSNFNIHGGVYIGKDNTTHIPIMLFFIILYLDRWTGGFRRRK